MYKLYELAQLVSGEVSGNSEVIIKTASEVDSAKDGSLVFVFDERFLQKAILSKASALLTSKKYSVLGKSAILVDNPRLSMARILKLFSKQVEVEKGIHQTSVVHKTAKLGENVSIGALVYIGPNVEIGNETIIYPNTTIYADTKIGNRCIIHSGARIGMDGYGFIPADGKLEKIPQVGYVIIEDDVEIYSNTCVARGTLGATIIGRGTKIDNLTHIAHNCEIGPNCALTSLVGLAGSVKLGENVSVGGQAGFSGHLTVGSNTIIMARSGVTKNIPSNSIVSGFPAIDHKKDMEILAFLRRIPQIFKKIK